MVKHCATAQSLVRIIFVLQTHNLLSTWLSDSNYQMVQQHRILVAVISSVVKIWATSQPIVLKATLQLPLILHHSIQLQALQYSAQHHRPSAAPHASLSSAPISITVDFEFTSSVQFESSTSAIIIPSSTKYKSFGISSNSKENHSSSMIVTPTSTPAISTTTVLPSLTSTQILNSTLSSSEVSSSIPKIFCPEDGIWKQTTACTSTTLQVCSSDLKTNG